MLKKFFSLNTCPWEKSLKNILKYAFPGHSAITFLASWKTKLHGCISATKVLIQFGKELIYSARIIFISGFPGSLIWAPRLNTSDCQLHTCMYMFTWCMHMSISTHVYMCGGKGIFHHHFPHSFNISLLCMLGDGVYVQAREQFVSLFVVIYYWWIIKAFPRI